MRLAVDGLFQSALAPLAVALLAFSLPGIVFWPYFTGLVLLAVGLPFLIKNEVPQAYGLDKIMPFGRLFYAMPMAVFGTEHFVFTPAVADMVPRWIPGHLFWVYFAGIALIAAALSIMMKKYSQLAATLLGVMLFLFVVLISVPRIVANPTDRFAWAVGLRDLAFSGGAFAFAGTQANVPPTSGLLSLVNLGRFFVAIPVLVFGVEHFLHPDFAPGVPLNKLTPAYIPARLLWAYLAGAVLIPAGACIILNKKARLAATSLGLMILLLVLIIYVPILVANPSSIGSGLNYFVDTLAFAGAALLLADAMPREDQPHV